MGVPVLLSHLTTFKACILHFTVELYLHLWLERVLQLRMIFTIDADFFTFVVGFYMMKKLYVCDCNTPRPQPSKRPYSLLPITFINNMRRAPLHTLRMS